VIRGDLQVAGVVRDVQRRPRHDDPVAQRFEDATAKRNVDRRERLVEQQQPRRRHHRASQRHALALAARQVGHFPIDQRLDRQHRQDWLERHRIASRSAVGDVAVDAEMRKQRRVLRHVADPPLADRHVDARRRVAQHRIPHGNTCGLRPAEARRHFEQRRLARARRPEQA
jgi:hypothetical protein